MASLSNQSRCCVCQHSQPSVGKNTQEAVRPTISIVSVYIIGKREVPPKVMPADLSGTLQDSASQAYWSNCLWVLTCFCLTCLIRETARALFSTSSQGTMLRLAVMSTVQDIVNNALKIMSLLQSENIVVTLIKLCSLSILK